jgi:hypothetical protein
VSLPSDVNECLNLYYSNSVEQCLYKYEKQFEFNMSFNGDLTAYEPKGENIALKREQQRLQNQKDEYLNRTSLSIQVPLV